MRHIGRRNNRFLIMSVGVLLFLISIGYAVLSSNYNFNGTIGIKGNTWGLTLPSVDDIEEEPSDPNYPVKVEQDEETGAVTISYTANLYTPGDVYKLVVPIRNEGTLDAMVSEVTTTPLSSEQQKFLVYSISAEDGTELLNKDLLSETGEIRVMITVRYRDDDPNNIPTDDVQGIPLKTTLQFSQKN